MTWLKFLVGCLAGCFDCALLGSALASSIFDKNHYEPEIIQVSSVETSTVAELTNMLLSAMRGEAAFPAAWVAQKLAANEIVVGTEALDGNAVEVRRAALDVMEKYFFVPSEGPLLFISVEQAEQIAQHVSSTVGYPQFSIDVEGALWLNRCRAFINPLTGAEMTLSEILPNIDISSGLNVSLPSIPSDNVLWSLRLRAFIRNILLSGARRYPTSGAPAAFLTLIDTQGDFFSRPDSDLLIDPLAVFSGTATGEQTLLLRQKDRPNDIGSGSISERSEGTLLVFGILRGPQPIDTSRYSFRYDDKRIDGMMLINGEFIATISCVKLEDSRKSTLAVDANFGENRAYRMHFPLLDRGLFSSDFFEASSDSDALKIGMALTLSIDPRTWMVGGAFTKLKPN